MKKKEKIERIIVDGLDAAGKTTLVETLAKHYKITDTPHENNLTNYPKKGYLKKLGKYRYIMDRSFLSEMVYAPLFGRDDRIVPELERAFMSALINNNVKVIICLNTLEDATAIMNERENEDINDYNYALGIKRWESIYLHLKKIGVNVVYYKLNEVKDGVKYPFLEGITYEKSDEKDTQSKANK